MSAGDATDLLLGQFARPGPVALPVALVVAHQDDEAIAAGGTLARLLELTLIHVTDGAPEQAADRAEIAARRRAELDAALQAACARPVRRLCYGVADGAVTARAEEVRQRLTADLMSVDAVLTHAYEGGHVDHDAIARAVHGAVATLRLRTGYAPAVLEFAGYHHHQGRTIAGRFWPNPTCPELALPLSPATRQRREAAFACFASQSFNLRYFLLDMERFRRAPDYDFSAPPPPVR